MDMGKMILSVACLSLIAAACASDVELGGPRDNPGGSAGASSKPDPAPVDDPSDSSSGGQSAAPGDPPDQPIDPATFANGQAACETDADCCVVVNDCSNTAYVVGLDDKDAATKAVAAERAEQEGIGHCTACIAAYVQVSCQNSKCVGIELDIRRDGLDERLARDHCGAIADIVQSSTDYGSMFGCGAR
jgi:hypothetical protein